MDSEDRPNGDSELAAKARDAFYTAVGFGVLAFQRVQVERRDLMRQLGTTDLRRVVRQVQVVVDPALDALDHRLPPSGRILLRQARLVGQGLQDAFFNTR